MSRDLKKDPYSVDEWRVVEWSLELTRNPS